MRLAPAERVLQLALALQGSRMGLSLSDIERQFGVGRRSAQRLRDAVLRVYPQTEQLVDVEQRPRWRISPGTVTPAALAADIEALLEAEGLAMRPGPKPIIREEVIDVVRQAIKEGRELYLHYRSPHSRRASGRRLQPYGFLLGKQHYLVGMSPDRHPGEARLFMLAHVKRVALQDRTFVRDPSFTLEKFAERSFGVFQGPPHDVVWKFAPDVAEAVAEYVFHPSQKMKRRKDGSTLVSFRAGGLLEMCWHLYTWGSHVEVLQPPELKEMMRRALGHRHFAVTEGA